MQQGICLLDKPKDFSSMKAVTKLKYKLKNDGHTINKIGHTGTLDPFATGLLPIFIGSTTKFSSLLLTAPKTYEFLMEFGKETDTGDLTGEIINTSSIIPSLSELQEALQHFLGKQQQAPHNFSAVHHNGIRAYKLARQGIEFTLPKKDIEIYDIKLIEYIAPFARITCTCSGGTYIRSLAQDIAYYLKTYAYLTELKRTAVGEMNISESSTLENPKILSHDHLLTFLEKLIPIIELTEKEAVEIIQGRYINAINITYDQALAHVKNHIIGLVKLEDTYTKAYKIINTDLLKNFIRNI